MGRRINREISFSPELYSEIAQMAQVAGGITLQEVVRRSLGSFKAIQTEKKAGRYVGSVANRAVLIHEFVGAVAGD
jgi:hypothetical protein